MAYANSVLFFYVALIMGIILVSNLVGGYQKDNSTKIFSVMLVLDIIMLLARGAEDYIIYKATIEGTETTKLCDFFGALSDLMYFLILALFIIYLDIYGKNEDYRPHWIAKVGSLLAFISALFWFFSDYFNLIYRYDENGFWAGSLYLVGHIDGYLIAIIAIIIFGINAKYYTNVEMVGLSFFIMLPLMGLVFNYLFNNTAVMVTTLTLNLIVAQGFTHVEREIILQKQKIRYANLQTDFLVSRMKPHFVYNVLNTIYYLCDTSSEDAKNAISMFSKYLRNNFVDYDSKGCLKFGQELSNVKNYLEIEKLRFGEELEIEYEIENDDFLIAPMALQIVVENAVRHGIEKKPHGGKIFIKEKRRPKGNLIEVVDTGVGFDSTDFSFSITEDKLEGRKHVGLYNCFYSLQSMCNGEIKIESSPGIGTTVTIWIPDKETKDENTYSRQ